jgi:hypothetical protein
MNNGANYFSEGISDAERAVLKALVMYEDRESGQRAKQLLDRLSKQAGIAVELKMKLWRFDLLSLPLALEQAALEAAEANVMLLSVNRKTSMSEADWEWMSRWLNHKEARPYLLCLMLGPEWNGVKPENPLIEEIHSFTIIEGVSFFCGILEPPSVRTETKFGGREERVSPSGHKAATEQRAL